MTRDRLPALSEVQRLTESELLAHAGGAEMWAVMAEAGLACFVDVDGDYWLGSPDEGFIEHDRWLYSLDAQDVADRGFTRNQQQLVKHCVPFKMDLIGHANIIERIAKAVLGPRAYQLGRTGYDSPEEKTRLSRNFLVVSREFKTLGSPLLIKARWTQDLHDILNHWDTWSPLHNPEGMPRELLLRMHGLGSYVDALRQGKNWVTGY